MARVANEVILKQLNWRYAVKRFDPNKKISDGDWSTIEESLRLAPSSYGLQPWRFIVVKNPKIREELRAVSWNQSQVTDCSHFVVLATRTDMEEKDVENYIAKIVSTRGASPESLEGYKKMMLGDVVHGERNKTIKWWAQRQVYIAFGMAMETAALLEIDTCPLEGIDPVAYDRILKLHGTGYSTVAALACGYRHADDKLQFAKKVRFDRSEVFIDV